MPELPFAVAGIVWMMAVLLALASTLFWLWALVDCLMREFREPLYKVMWVLVVVFLHFLGAILYLLIGRSQGYRR